MTRRELLITVGVSEALLLALMAILDPGDEVIVPEPCFVAYRPTVIFGGGVPVAVPTYVEQDFQVTVADLERARIAADKGGAAGLSQQPDRGGAGARAAWKRSPAGPRNTTCW